jgi:hypothetical protein
VLSNLSIGGLFYGCDFTLIAGGRQESMCVYVVGGVKSEEFMQKSYADSTFHRHTVAGVLGWVCVCVNLFGRACVCVCMLGGCPWNLKRLC